MHLHSTLTLGVRCNAGVNLWLVCIILISRYLALKCLSEIHCTCTVQKKFYVNFNYFNKQLNNKRIVKTMDSPLHGDFVSVLYHKLVIGIMYIVWMLNYTFLFLAFFFKAQKHKDPNSVCNYVVIHIMPKILFWLIFLHLVFHSLTSHRT